MNKICELPNSLKIEGSELTVSLFLDPKLAWFKGHFPEQSILPGVAQIDWARLYAAKIAAHNICKELPQIKFTLPLVPNETVSLKESVREVGDKSIVSFRFEVVRGGVTLTASQGRICLY